MTEVVVIVLNYKTPELAVAAAQSAATAMHGMKGAILLVDNASPDKSFEQMQESVGALDWPENLVVQVLQSGRNGGFGAGNNFGIRAGRSLCPNAEFVYILNPDARVEPGAIAALVSYLQTHPSAAIAGSWIYDEQGHDACSAFRFPGIASEFEASIRFGPVTRLLKNHVVPLHLPEASGPVGWIVGASMLVRTDALTKIGLFDETFFLYFEETDLCLRANRHGLEVHFVRDSKVCHIGSVSTGMGTWNRTPRYWFESRWYYYSKNYGRLYAIAATGMNVLGTSLWRLRRWIERKPNTDAAYFLRDLIAHDVGAFFRPTPSTSIQKLKPLPQANLQPNAEQS